jgi:hypothetical protein
MGDPDEVATHMFLNPFDTRRQATIGACQCRAPAIRSQIPR